MITYRIQSQTKPLSMGLLLAVVVLIVAAVLGDTSVRIFIAAIITLLLFSRIGAGGGEVSVTGELVRIRRPYWVDIPVEAVLDVSVAEPTSGSGPAVISLKLRDWVWAITIFGIPLFYPRKVVQVRLRPTDARELAEALHDQKARLLNDRPAGML